MSLKENDELFEHWNEELQERFCHEHPEMIVEDDAFFQGAFTHWLRVNEKQLREELESRPEPVIEPLEDRTDESGLPSFE